MLEKCAVSKVVDLDYSFKAFEQKMIRTQHSIDYEILKFNAKRNTSCCDQF